MNSFIVVGNLTEDPELRFTPSGAPVANFSIAETPRKYDGETKQWKDAGETNYYRCTVWNKQAENVADSLRKGTRTIAIGKLRTEKYKRNEEWVTSTNNLDIDNIGPALNRATAVVTKNPSDNENYSRGNNGGGNNGGGYSNGGGNGGYNNGGGNNGGGNGGFNGGGYDNNPSTGGYGNAGSNEPPF